VNPFIVAIDGPAGAGKTTVSQMLARRLGCLYVDTGALYRGVAVLAMRRDIGLDDDLGLAKLCENLKMDLELTPDATRVLANGEDITAGLRTPEVSMAASAISARPVVRAWLLTVQRSIGTKGSCVFEGRDMGTVVFPDAKFKFFLTADPRVRAVRRHKELTAKGPAPSLVEVERDIRLRDRNDSTRSTAPMAAAPDAIFLDSTEKNADEVVKSMLEIIREAQEIN